MGYLQYEKDVQFYFELHTWYSVPRTKRNLLKLTPMLSSMAWKKKYKHRCVRKELTQCIQEL